MDRDQAFYVLALTLVPGLGLARIHQIMGELKAPSLLFENGIAELRRLRLSFEIQDFVASGCAVQAAEEAIAQAGSQGAEIVSLLDPGYPSLLRQIHDPPLILYCRGNVALLSEPSVSIVGSRKPSLYGREVTLKLSSELAGHGLTIVSGLARGIDAAAHNGCLKAGGKTVAVLGNGVDVVYPKENRRLYRSVAEKGCLISEFPMGRFPAPQNFPIRNRIISGLSLGTLITEAARYSGSLITARLALEQDRELWGLPGNITTPGSYGPNLLILQGAKPILSTQDLLDELPDYVLETLVDKTPELVSSAPERPSRTPAQEQILKLLNADSSLHVDCLFSHTSMSLGELNQALIQLEIEGAIATQPGRHYSLKLS